MPVGYSSRCRVCNSPHRVDIEKWCKEEGLSPRGASARLKQEFDEKISHQSIWKHMNEHFDVKAEAREQYHRSQAQLQKAVQKHLSDLEMLDALVQGNYDLYQEAQAWAKDLVNNRVRIPKALVDLLSVTAGEVRQQLKQKQAMLGDDPEANGIADLANILCEAWDVLKDAKTD